MRDKNIIWLYLFLIATLLDLAFLVEGNYESRYFSKPFILLGLIIYFLRLSAPIRGTLLSKAILSALIFSWLGDILLLWDQLFAYGLGSFLIAQGCYIIGFKVAQYNPGKIGKVNFIRTFIINLPIYFIGALVFYLINPNLGALKIPVAIYIIVIVMMATTARERFRNCSPASFWQVFIGACFFLISDAVIALNKFYEYQEGNEVVIMGTYAIAQLLIVMGIRSHILKPIKKEA